MVTRKFRDKHGNISPDWHGELPDVARLCNHVGLEQTISILLGKRNYVYKSHGRVLFFVKNGSLYMNKSEMPKDYRISTKAWDGLKKYHGHIPSAKTLYKDSDIPNAWVDHFILSINNINIK